MVERRVDELAAANAATGAATAASANVARSKSSSDDIRLYSNTNIPMADRRRTWAGCVARNALDDVPGLVKLISGIRDWYAQWNGIVGRTEHWWYGVTLRKEIGWTQLVDREEAVGRISH